MKHLKQLIWSLVSLVTSAFLLSLLLSASDPSDPLPSSSAPSSLVPSSPSPSSLQMSVSELVNKLIAENLVMVFSKSWCGYSAKAKRVLAKYPLTGYSVLELDSRNDMEEIQDYLGQLTGGRSVPRVFIKGKFIGGGDDTERLDREGELKQMLIAAGAIKQ